MTELATLTESIKAEIDSMNATFDAKKKELTKVLQGQLHGLVKTAFDENERLLAITWTQYTPYFNDGDACEFSVGEIDALLAPESISDPSTLDNADIEELLEETYFEGNLCSNLQFADSFRTYLTTGVVTRTHYLTRAWYDEYTEDKLKGIMYGDWPTKFTNGAESLDAFNEHIKPHEHAYEVTKALGNIPEEIMEELFGDHAQIVITREGIDVNSYDHE